MSNPLKAPSIAEIATRLAEGSMVLVDVRELAEVQASGIAKDAVHIPLAMLPLRANPSLPDRHPSLKPDVAVALYCMAGGRAGRAADALRALGYGEVYNLGGLSHWQEAGGQVVPA